MSIYTGASKLIDTILEIYSQKSLSLEEKEKLEHLKNYLLRGDEYMDECTHSIVLTRNSLDYVVTTPKNKRLSAGLAEKFELTKIDSTQIVSTDAEKPFDLQYIAKDFVLSIHFNPNGNSDGVYFKADLVPKKTELQ